MIRFDDVTITYVGADRAVLRSVDVEIAEGDLCVVIGATGAGKSTLLGAVNGLVPHFTGGHLAGRVTVGGRDTRAHPPRELADLVGVVGQDPSAGFVTDTVEEELAYGMEQQAVPPAAMRKRVEETLDLLGLAGLRHRPLRTLSGGEQQRVAIGAALTAHRRVLVLDEPTSALDPTAAEEVLATISRLVHDVGITAIVAEHRLERVLHAADQVLQVHGDGSVTFGPPADVLATGAIVPPIVELGRLAGWHPLPLSVRDARRVVAPLREQLGPPPPPPARSVAETVIEARGVVVRHGAVVAVHDLDVDLRAGEVVAVMGRNGAGKSSLLWALQGAGPRQGGTVAVRGDDPARLDARAAKVLVALVPQSPADLLYLETVGAECAQADAETGATTGTCRSILVDLVPDVDDDQHPRDLSEGQRLALVLAVQLTAGPAALLLDEPTRGLDYATKRRLGIALRALAGQGTAVALATHDVEFVAAVADRVVVLADGEIVASGPTVEVVAASPAFAPQVAKVLAPEPWLTVDQVAGALPAPQGSTR